MNTTETQFGGIINEVNATTARLHYSTEYGQAESNNGSSCVEIPLTSPRGCSDPQSLFVSMATRLLMEDVVFIGCLPLLTMVGVTVNVFNMAVFVKQGLRDRVRLSLFSLSLTDLLVVTTMCVLKVNRIIAQFTGQARASELWVIPLVRYKLYRVPSSFQLMSIFISIVIAVDRCVCVTWPLHAAHVLSTRATGLVILVFSVLIFAGNMFVQFKLDVKCVYVAGKETSPFLIMAPSELYKRMPAVIDVLRTFVLTTLIPTLSFLITAAATSITAITLKRASAWRGSTAGSDVINQKERALTSMVITISSVYLTCLSPAVVLPLCQFFIPEFNAFGRMCNLMMVVETAMNATLALNSTINFFVYYTMGSSFRRTLHQLLMPLAVRCSSNK